MRIALITGKFPVLSQTFVISHITGLIELGHDVDIYTTKLEKKNLNYLNSHGIEKYRLLERIFYCTKPSNLGKRFLKGFGLSLLYISYYPRIICRLLNVARYGRRAASLSLLYFAIPILKESGKYDIIHCHFGWNGIVGAMLREAGVIQGPLVTTFHGADMTSFISKFGKQCYRHLFKHGDLFLPVSNVGRSKLIDLGCDEDKIRVHRMGIDCDRFRFTPRRFEGNQIRLISVSRLVEKKGIEYSIKAVAKLISAFPNIRYQIIGDGPLKKDLQKLISDLDINRWITLAGWKGRNELVIDLSSAHISLLPSVTSHSGEQEGIPVSLMEFMAVGLPVISTFHSGIPELIENNISGFLVPERDVESLAGKLKDLIEQPVLWSDIGYQARRTIETNYNNVVLNERLVTLYKDLVKDKSYFCKSSINKADFPTDLVDKKR